VIPFIRKMVRKENKVDYNIKSNSNSWGEISNNKRRIYW
jgi:hypothetical protein